MCQQSFNRATLAAIQFVKYNDPNKAMISLNAMRRYSDNVPSNMTVISDMEKQIKTLH